MNIKCIAVDLDGTLLNQEGQVSAYTKQILEIMLSKNIEIIVASGRAVKALPDSVMSIEGIRYAVTSNGAAMYDLREERCLLSRSLQEQAVETLLVALSGEEVTYEAFIDGIPYAQKEYIASPVSFGATEHAVSYIQTTRQPVDDMVRFIQEHKKCLDSIDVIVKTPKIKESVWKKLISSVENIHVTSSVRQLLEISDSQATKASGIAFFCELLGILPTEVMAFGDADNDIEMLQYVGRGIAMANGSERVKNIADAITESNVENGVAKECQRILGIM